MPFQSDRPVRLRSLALLAGACVAMAAQAGTVEPNVDLLRAGGGQTAPSAGALERALTIDINTSQRNLEVLLEARRAGETVSPMRAGGPPGKTPALPAVQDRGGLVPMGLQAQDSVTAPGATERREWQGGVPGGGQAGEHSSRAALGRQGADAADAGQGSSGRGTAKGEPHPVAEVLEDLRSFVRDNRFGLLAGAVLLMLAVGGVQVLARRR